MITLLAAAAAAVAAPAQSAPSRPPAVKVAEIRSDRSCELLVANWRWLLIECVNHFPKLRTALQSALLDSNKVRLSTSNGRRDSIPAELVVSASVTGLGSSVQRASARDYCVASDRLEGRMDYRVRRAATGEVLYGGSVTKSVEVASHAVAGDSRCSVGAEDPQAYEQLEREIALAAARAIVFRIAPLRVSESDERGISLNYGAPFLRMGDAIDIFDHGRRARYRVTGTQTFAAFAVPDGHKMVVPAGALAAYVEQDDASNNARRFEKVDLP